MSNPFNALNGQNINNNISPQSIQNIQSLYKLMCSNNPMAVFQQLANNNPNLRPILDLVNKGNNPQQIFNYLCSQRGIDPTDFIKKITGCNQ